MLPVLKFASMSIKKIITIVDYGVGNLLSLQRGFEHLGAEVVITADIEKLRKANYIVLPGVGAFSNAMNELCKLNLVDPIIEITKKGVPLLGVCLGVQLLCDSSEELGETKGLGLIAGNVVRIPNKNLEGERLKTPQIGWNELIPNNDLNWEGTILRDLSENDALYFVHSFMAVPKDKKHLLAYCLYGGNKITAVIQKDNIIGCQFHPEKSGKIGLLILKNFLEQ
jgi:imidazole glycerol-phosphate synthase subunit HisH